MPALSAYAASDSSSPRVLQERGSLRTLSGGKSQFIGSSSGVYFVNTVRRAFSDANTRSFALLQDTAHPSPEDCLVPDDEDEDKAARPRRSRAATGAAAVPSVSSGLSYGPNIPPELGRPPPPELAKKLFMTYFRTWHQFFPFLHGPTLLRDIEQLYAAIDGQSQDALRSQKPLQLPLANVVILQCLFNLASLHDEDLPATSKIDQPLDILSSLPGMAVKSDIMSIQALFAAQLLLVARMSLRTAAAVGGLLSRAIFLAGLHRCPVRYRELSLGDCDIRKRLFWSIYVIDRYLSQALGHPLGIQDSDVDVCSLAGPELHDNQFQSTSQHGAADKRHESISTPTPHSGRRGSSLSTRPQVRLNREISSSPGGIGDGATLESPRSNPEFFTQKPDRHLVLAFHANYSRLLGRAVELFHKSIHVRSMDPGSVLLLRTDVNAWWNGLPSYLQDVNPSSGSKGPGEQEAVESNAHDFSVPAFFNLLHSQLVLLINRPWLSLEPTSPEFHAALQTCIGVSREIITILKKQRDTGFALFWPGYLSAAWMAGIILVFACHLRLYPEEKGQVEIPICLEVLSAMSSRWRLARNCHTVLLDLQQTFEATKDAADNFPVSMRNAGDRSRFDTAVSNDPDPTSTPVRPSTKRRRLNPDPQEHQPGMAASLTTESSAARSPNNPEQAGGSNAVPDMIAPAPAVSISSAMWSPVNKLSTTVLSGDASGTTANLDGSQHVPIPNTSFPPLNGIGTVDAMSGLGATGSLESMPMYTFGGDDTRWMTESGALSNWDSGMPDVFAGATWESLLHVVNQDNLTWDDVLG